SIASLCCRFGNLTKGTQKKGIAGARSKTWRAGGREPSEGVLSSGGSRPPLARKMWVFYRADRGSFPSNTKLGAYPTDQLLGTRARVRVGCQRVHIAQRIGNAIKQTPNFCVNI